jgi:hypothetical protein
MRRTGDSPGHQKTGMTQMTSMTGSVQRPIINVELPSLIAITARSPVTAQGMREVARGLGLALYAVFVPMFLAYFAARALGLNTLCYDELHLQAASIGLSILPFGIYMIAQAGRRSLRSVFTVSAVVSSIVGVLLAAMV